MSETPTTNSSTQLAATPATPPLKMCAPPINPATGKPPPPKIKDLGIYYTSAGHFYFYNKATGTVVPSAQSNIRLRLLQAGFSNRVLPGAAIAEVDAALLRIQEECLVNYVGPLAGKSVGVYEQLGNRILVTSSPKIIEPDATVECPTIAALLDAMLGTEQLVYFHGWLAHAYSPLRRGAHSLGQVLALVGPPDAGKTLLQAIIRETLGGREASPYGWMMGRTAFNGGMFGAEALNFGDEVSARDFHARARFGDCVKQLASQDTQECAFKNREKLTLKPFWRTTMSLNEDPLALAVLPPLGPAGISDKITILKVTRPSAVFDSSPWATGDREENWARIVRELPGFLARLAAFQVPAELRSTRLGIKAWQHPEVLAEVEAESPAMRLLDLIDRASICVEHGRTRIAPESGVHGENSPAPWEGTSTQLEKALFESSFEVQARRLLYWEGAAGTFLHILSRTASRRVTKLPTTVGKLHVYRIAPAAA